MKHQCKSSYKTWRTLQYNTQTTKFFRTDQSNNFKSRNNISQLYLDLTF